jgi:hypothetical protein
VAAVLAGLCGSALWNATPVLAAPPEQPSPPREVVAVTVNAWQTSNLSTARLAQLASALRDRPTASDGNYYAPDVLIVEEISASYLSILRDDLNNLFASNRYAVVGATTSDVKAKFIVNTSTMTFRLSKTWVDVCESARRYQLINVTENASDLSVTVGGVHFLKDYEGLGGASCRNQNAIEARRQLAAPNTRGNIVGDFNRRAMLQELECDPNETSGDASWYADMTAYSSVDNVSYIDSVRRYNRATNQTMAGEWTQEFQNTSTLCDGTTGYKRSRIDYIFVSDTLNPLDAHADHPGWANESQPGSIGCTPAPDCRYSDHRFVWARVSLGAPDTTAPSDPVNLTATGGKRKISLSWTGSTDAGGSGLGGYEVWRSASGGVGTFAKIATSTATSYTDSGLRRGATYWYYVVAYDNAGNRSGSSNTVSATAS